MGTVSFGVNASDVMHETIDDEVIAINLVSGNYYSLRGSGAEVWALVSDGGPMGPSGLTDVLVARYSTPRAEIEAEVTRFLDELAREGLVAAREGVDVSARPVLTSVEGSQGAFEPPSLERYSDMQDLVLLDPVHQVDDAGWPHTQAEDAAPASRSA